MVVDRRVISIDRARATSRGLFDYARWVFFYSHLTWKYCQTVAMWILKWNLENWGGHRIFFECLLNPNKIRRKKMNEWKLLLYSIIFFQKKFFHFVLFISFEKYVADRFGILLLWRINESWLYWIVFFIMSCWGCNFISFFYADKKI